MTVYHAWGKEPHTKGTYTTYAICDPETDEVVYVGVTGQNPYKRFSQHLVAIKGTQKYSKLYLWLRELAAAGKEPKFRILERNIPKYDWRESEIRWIAALNPSLNEQPGG